MIQPDCTFTPYWERTHPEGCWACGGELTRRQRKWCSQGCSLLWVRNHLWGQTRHYAVIRARHLLEEPDWDSLGKEYMRRFYLYECVICHSLTDAPEVDHINPMNGDPRGKPDCRNHQANLRVLDHACHAGVTAGQAMNRAIHRRVERTGTEQAVMAW